MTTARQKSWPGDGGVFWSRQFLSLAVIQNEKARWTTADGLPTVPPATRPPHPEPRGAGPSPAASAGRN